MTKVFSKDKVRLDKWLWAARFFKTRSLAKAAIESGKVRCGGQRAKAAKEILIGELLTIRRGLVEIDLQVVALAEQRRGAAEAALLYAETAASAARRVEQVAARKAGLGGFVPGQQKPTKKERRQMARFKAANTEPQG